MKRFMNRNQLKYLVILAMVVDHVAWAFVPTRSLPGQLMHTFGRLTGPTMAFFLAEGYHYTRSVPHYARRLGLFALLSWVPYSLFETGTWPSAQFGVIYTLLLGLLAIWFWDKSRCHRIVKLLVVFALCWLSQYGDWPVFDVLFPLIFFLYRDNPKHMWLGFCLISLFFTVFPVLLVGWEQAFQFGVFLVPPLIHFCYSGQSGSRHPFHKWFFYVFYPAHLLLLFLLKAALG